MMSYCFEEVSGQIAVLTKQTNASNQLDTKVEFNSLPVEQILFQRQHLKDSSYTRVKNIWFAQRKVVCCIDKLKFIILPNRNKTANEFVWRKEETKIAKRYAEYYLAVSLKKETK